MTSRGLPRPDSLRLPSLIAWAAAAAAGSVAAAPPEVPTVSRVLGGQPVTIGLKSVELLTPSRRSPQTRLLAAVLTVSTAESAVPEITVDLSSARLNFGGVESDQRGDRVELARGLYRFTRAVGWSLTELPPAGPVSVSPGGTVDVAVVFADLRPGSDVPAVSLADASLDRPIDLRVLSDTAAGVSSRAIGPKAAIGVVDVPGRLNGLSVQTLCDAVRDHARGGRGRVIVSLSGDESFATGRIGEWLSRATLPSPGMINFYRDLPPLPGTLQEFRVADPAGQLNVDEREIRRRDTPPPRIDASLDASVAAVMTGITAGMNRDDVMAALRADSQPGVRAGLLRRGRDVFKAGDLPVVLSAIENDSESVRVAAVEALGAFPQAEAGERLASLFASGDAAVRRAAQSALASARHPSLAAGLRQLPPAVLTDAAALSELAVNPRAEWAGDLRAAADSGDPDVRAAALAGLMRLGGEVGRAATTRAILDDSADVRDRAIRLITEGGGQDLRAAAADAARRRLMNATIDAPLLSLLEDARDREVIEKLLGGLPGYDRMTAAVALRIIARGGDSAQESRLVDVLLAKTRQRRVSSQDAQLVRDGLLLLRARRSPRLNELAEAVLASDMSRSVSSVRAALAGTADAASLKLLAGAFERTDDARDLIGLADAIAKVGGPAVRQYLQTHVRGSATDGSPDADRQRAALAALQTLATASPAVPYWRRNGVSDDLEVVRRAAATAAEIDPHFAEGWFSVGIQSLQQTPPQIAAAEDAFAKGLAADPLSADNAVGAALAAAAAGQSERAVETIDTLPQWMTRQPLAAYNAACVFGVVVAAAEDAGGTGPQPLQTLRERGLDLLETSIGGGLEIPAETIRADPDLTPLHGERFDAILEVLNEPKA